MLSVSIISIAFTTSKITILFHINAIIGTVYPQTNSLCFISAGILNGETATFICDNTTTIFFFSLFNQEGLFQECPGQDRQHQVITKRITDRQHEKLQVI
jgi:hypothetical protein